MNERIKAVVRAVQALEIAATAFAPTQTLGDMVDKVRNAYYALTPEDLAECGVEQYDSALPLYTDGTPSREWPGVGA